jgi:phage gpG-like protein
VKTGAHVLLDNVSNVIDGIARLTSTRVMVGVPGDKTDRDDNSPITNADLAYIHEHGAPEVGIPARPFMYPGVEKAQDEITTKFEQVGHAALDGKPDAVDRGFNAAGLIAQRSIRAKITEGPFVPLKPSTIAARKRRGRTGTKPLIDTGQLRSAINYVIRKA